MGRKNFTPEQIISILRQIAEAVARDKTLTLEMACSKAGISLHTYYRRGRDYGVMQISQAKKLKLLEKENARLKKLLADQVLDNSILKELAWGH